jgi:hypothetical protein
MLVLDFLRRTSAPGTGRQPAIEVPRFHAGHLGFLPDTRVYTGLVPPESISEKDSPDVLVTPLHTGLTDLAVLSVTLRDYRGVVGDLVDIVSGFGYNIEIQESSSIDALNHHHVDLLLDLSRRRGTIGSTPNRVRHIFGQWKANLPTSDLRFVELFSAIVERCGERLVWRNVAGQWTPDLTIRPLPARQLENPEPTTLIRAPHGKTVLVPLPDGLADRLPGLIGDRRASHLHYVYVSDTSQRMLRASFIQSSRAARMVHLGFEHNDAPMELVKILRVLDVAQFNIVTSLLRKYSRKQSIWEAILEYEGRDEVPSFDPDAPAAQYTTTVIRWAQEKFARAAARTKEIESGSVSIGPPLYPRRYLAADRNFEIKNVYVPIDWRKTNARGLVTASGPQTKRRSMGEAADDPLRQAQARLDEVVRQFRTRQRERRLFLSYPKTAATLVDDYLDRRLRRGYKIVRYQESTPTAITATIVELIRGSDYFVGIWHPEAVTGATMLSPWMHFEFGVAFARGIPRLIAVHESFPSEVWDRIDRDAGKLKYTDADFGPKLVPKIIAACKEHFK